MTGWTDRSTAPEPAIGGDGPLASIAPSLLERVLDALVPAVDELPAAGALGLAPAVLEAARTAPLHAAAAAGILSGLDPSATGTELIAALKAGESTDPGGFRSLLVLVLSAYYADGRVRRRLERETGYPADPPQPSGYALPPFDESILTAQRSRAPFWRQTEG